MKLSVSVPDGLWEEARAVRPDLNPSGIVQAALEAWHSERSPAFPHDPPADVGEAFSQARDRLAAHARQEFERGYRAGVVVAPEIEWWVLEALATQHFSVRLWAENLALVAQAERAGEVPEGTGPSQASLMCLREALGPALPWADDEDLVPNPSAPYLRGFSAAMRDLWEAAFEGPIDRSVSRSRSGARSRSTSSRGQCQETAPGTPAKQRPRTPEGEG